MMIKPQKLNICMLTASFFLQLAFQLQNNFGKKNIQKYLLEGDMFIIFLVFYFSISCIIISFVLLHQINQVFQQKRYHYTILILICLKLLLLFGYNLLSEDQSYLQFKNIQFLEFYLVQILFKSQKCLSMIFLMISEILNVIIQFQSSFNIIMLSLITILNTSAILVNEYEEKKDDQQENEKGKNKKMKVNKDNELVSPQRIFEVPNTKNNEIQIFSHRNQESVYYDEEQKIKMKSLNNFGQVAEQTEQQEFYEQKMILNQFPWLNQEKYILVDEKLECNYISFILSDYNNDEEINNLTIQEQFELLLTGSIDIDYQNSYQLEDMKNCQSLKQLLVLINYFDEGVYINIKQLECDSFKILQDLKIYKQISQLIILFSSKNNILLDVFQSVSHEFGTYLNCLCTLSQSGLNDEGINYKEHFQHLYTNSYLLNLILSNVRDYNQFMMNDFILKIEQFNVFDEIKNIAILMDQTIKQKKIKLIYNNQLIHNRNIIYSDINRFRQVVFQILSNSIRFTNNGIINITLKSDINHNINISIEDTGIGMNELEKENLNQLLLGNPKRVSKNSVGCGIGLMTSNLIVQKLSNQGITFKSQETKGSKFQFLISNQRDLINNQFSSLDKQHSCESYFENNKSIISFKSLLQSRSRQFKSSLKPKSVSRSQRSLNDKQFQSRDDIISQSSQLEEGLLFQIPQIIPQLKQHILQYQFQATCCKKVLIVDDEYFNILSVQIILRKFTTLTDYAFNGKEALEKIQLKEKCMQCGCKSYILYIIDINMPVMDGLQTVKILKSQMLENKIDYGICIANTGFVDLRTKIECYNAGMDYYLTKPINRKEFHEYLENKFNIEK